MTGVNDAAGQHHDWDAFSSEFSYDDNGNMTSQTGKFTNIAYEHRNLPIHFYLDNEEELIANYNAEGQRILKESSGGGWSFYITDGMQTLAVITEEGLSHMNLVGNGMFGRIPVNLSGNITTSNTRYYHLTDHLGSTRAVVNNSGGLVETFDYYPFGLLMPKRNTASAETREKFTGHERDDEVGLDYMVWRRYDPALGRFLSVDPLAGEFPGWSPYSYVFNNPLIFIDPTGEYPTCGDNCDEYYQEGSIVENQYGSWTYQGNNQWTDVSGNAVSGTDLLASFNQMLEGGFISQWEPSWADRWSESSNIFATLSYSLLNSPWVALQALNPFDNTVTHISGALATPREQLDAGVASAPIGYGVGKISGAARAGRELTFSSNFRIAPFGNRTGHSTGRFPHYHRRVLDDKGNVRPGGSMKRHRPWDTRSTDKSIWERF